MLQIYVIYFKTQGVLADCPDVILQFNVDQQTRQLPTSLIITSP